MHQTMGELLNARRKFSVLIEQNSDRHIALTRFFGAGVDEAMKLPINVAAPAQNTGAAVGAEVPIRRLQPLLHQPPGLVRGEGLPGLDGRLAGHAGEQGCQIILAPGQGLPQKGLRLGA